MVPIEDDWDSQDDEAVNLVLDDDDATRAMRRRGGSSKGKKANIERGRESGHFNLIRDYFGPAPIYSDEQFARRFCMPRDLFLRIAERVTQRDPYFQQRRNVTGKLGLSTLQKCTAAIRILSTGSAADTIDDYVRIGESTALKCLKRFALGLIDEFGDEYLRDPTKEDIEHYMEINASRGYPGMFGSIAEASDNQATQTQRSQSKVLQLDDFVRECAAIKNEANYFRLRDALIHHAELNV